MPRHDATPDHHTPLREQHSVPRAVTSEERAYVDALVTVLAQRGLTARALRGGVVRAENRAALPAEDDRLARAFHPGLQQEVACRPADGGGALWWFWVWSGPTRDAPDELEPPLPAGELSAVADKLTAVLALRPQGGS